MMQHAYENGYVVLPGDGKWNRRGAAIQGSSFLVIPWYLKWVTLGIEYHHIHHLTAVVPGYRLQECHDAIPRPLSETMMAGPGGVTTMGWAAMWGSLWITVYDDDRRRYSTYEALYDNEAQSEGQSTGRSAGRTNPIVQRGRGTSTAHIAQIAKTIAKTA
jgi:fatty acid desaturase